jgi:hypothetical protein
MVWEVELAPAFDEWFRELGEDDQEAVVAAVDALKRQRDVLHAPMVGPARGKRRRARRELRVAAGILVRFAVDSRRSAIILEGGERGGR